MIRSSQKLVRSLVAAPLSFFVLALIGCTSGPRGVPPTSGMPNFGRANEGLYRGAQPTEKDLKRMQRLGIQTIINLRPSEETWPAEQDVAQRLGLSYISFPLHGIGAPTEDQVARLLSLIEVSPSPVFIHCEHGADRTGTLVACYRLQNDGWRIESALAEADLYGFSIFQFGMRHFIRDFASQRLDYSPGRELFQTPLPQILLAPISQANTTAPCATWPYRTLGPPALRPVADNPPRESRGVAP